MEEFFPAWNATNTPVGTKLKNKLDEISVEERNDTHEFRVI